MHKASHDRTNSFASASTTAALLGAALTAALSITPANAQTTGAISATTYQTMEGFGTSLAWWKDVDISSNTYAPSGFYENAQRRDLFTEGLGASMLRVPMHIFGAAGGTPDTDPNTLFDEFFPTNEQLAEPLNLTADTYANLDYYNVTNRRGVSHVVDFAAHAQANAQDDVKVIGMITSPPHWMKMDRVSSFNNQTQQPLVSPYLATSGGSGFGNSVGGSLADGRTVTLNDGSTITYPDMLQQFGRHVTAYLLSMKQAGVDMSAVNIQNEPINQPNFDSAIYSPQLFRDALKAVRAEIDTHNASVALNADDMLDVVLIGPEDTGVGTDLFQIQNSNGGWDGAFNTQIWRQNRFLKVIDEDPEASDALGVNAIHGYQTLGIVQGTNETLSASRWELFANGGSLESQYSFYDALYDEDGNNDVNGVFDLSLPGAFPAHAGNPDRPIWVTEASEHEQEWLSFKTMTVRDKAANGSLSAPYTITVNNGALQVAVDIHESIVLGGASAYLYWQMSMSENFDNDAPSQRQSLTDDNQVTKKLAAFAHFSKFVRPGMERLDVDLTSTELLISAFATANGEDLTLVSINPFDMPISINLEIPAEFQDGLFVGVRTGEIETFIELPEMNADGTTLSYTVPAYSVATFTTMTDISRSIPEPGTAALLALGSIMALRRRRA